MERSPQNHRIVLIYNLYLYLLALVVKNPPAKQKTWVRSLGWGDPVEKEMATYSSILAWEIPWTEEPGRLWPMELQKSWTRHSDETTPTTTHLYL